MDLLSLNGRIAWLAFCSGTYLKREGRRLYPPDDIWKERGGERSPTNFSGFSDRTVVFNDGFGLPKSVHLQAARRGFPVLQYGVSSSTNVCGWEFPQEFYLAQYRPAYSWDSNRFDPDGWEVDFMAKGAIVDIRPGLKPESPAVRLK